MKRIMVAVPTREYIDVDSEKCIRKLEKDSWINRDIEVDVHLVPTTIIHDGRFALAQMAIKNKYDYILWIDSDMVFESTVLYDLLEADKDIVSAVCFMRRAPYEPCIYSKMRMGATLEEDQIEKYYDYPEGVFEVEACGLAMVLMKVVVLEDILYKTGQPFFPIRSDHRTLGEDLSFCYNARKSGHKIWATSKPKVGHIGKMIVDRDSYAVIRRNNG